MPVLKFLGSSNGRWVRTAAGLALIVVGGLLGGWWWILSGVGALVLAAGVFDFCLIAPLAGKPIAGKAFRASFQE